MMYRMLHLPIHCYDDISQPTFKTLTLLAKQQAVKRYHQVFCYGREMLINVATSIFGHGCWLTTTRKSSLPAHLCDRRHVLFPPLTLSSTLPPSSEPERPTTDIMLAGFFCTCVIITAEIFSVVCEVDAYDRYSQLDHNKK